MNGDILSDMIDRKPVLADLLKECRCSKKCRTTKACPYDVTLREMIQVAMNRKNECPCTWVRKKSTFADELNTMSECLAGGNAPWKSALLTFFSGMLISHTGIAQVEKSDAVENGDGSRKQNETGNVIVIHDEEAEGMTVANIQNRVRSPQRNEIEIGDAHPEQNGHANLEIHDGYAEGSPETKKRGRKQIFPARLSKASALVTRKHHRLSQLNGDDVPGETPPISPAEEEDEIAVVPVENNMALRERKKRRKPRRSPWDRRKRKSTAASDDIATEVPTAEPEPAKRRRIEEPTVVVNGEPTGEGTSRNRVGRPPLKRAVGTDRKLRSKQSEVPSYDQHESEKMELRGFSKDDVGSATYYYVLFKNFLKSDLCDVKLTLFYGK